MNNLNKYDRREKQYRKWNKERRAIGEAQRSEPWVPVDRPYQHGWHLTIELRDDAKRRADAHVLQAVIDMCMHKGYTKTPKLVSAVRRCKRLDEAFNAIEASNSPRYQNFSYAPAYRNFTSHWFNNYSGYPYIGVVTKEQYDKMPSDLARLFYEYKDHDLKYWNYSKKNWNPYKTSISHSLLKMRVRPAVVTHVRAIDPVLQRRDAELDALLEPYFRRLSYGGHLRWEYYYGRRAHRAAERAAIARFIKGESEDFEIKQKIRNYHG